MIENCNIKKQQSSLFYFRLCGIFVKKQPIVIEFEEPGSVMLNLQTDAMGRIYDRGFQMEVFLKNMIEGKTLKKENVA